MGGSFLFSAKHHHKEKTIIDVKVIRTLEPMDGEPLVLALVTTNYEIRQCRLKIDDNH